MIRLLKRLAIGAGLLVLILGLSWFAAIVVRWWGFRQASCRIAPLMFHAVMPNKKGSARYWMTEAQFARQMDALHAAGVATPPLDSVVQWLEGGARDACPFPARSAVITFDLDGESHHLAKALPHLQRNGLRAVFYIPLMALDHGSGVTTDEVRGLAQAGMAIASHSEWHQDLRQEQPDSMIASLQRTQARLGEISGQAITSLSAPGGRYDARVVADVRRAGFSSFFTSDPCYITTTDTPARLCRIEIRGDGGMTALEAVESPWRVAVQATGWGIKRGVERLVGTRIWFLLNFLRRSAEGPGY